jgi:protein phosphatase
MKIEGFGLTDLGKKRKLNEDSLGLFPENGLYVVADGMGGHAGGEIASRLAVDSVEEFIKLSANRDDITWPFEIDESKSKDENRLNVAIRLANSRIFQEALINKKLNGMGTTIVTALFAESHLYIGHVGDSRAYLIKNDEIKQLTDDHSVVYEQMRLGVLSKEDAKTHSLRNVLTKALGTEPDIRVDMRAEKAEAGNIYLFCTDGLTNMLTDEEMHNIVKNEGNNIENACRELIAAANRNGGIDNITVIILKIV